MSKSKKDTKISELTTDNNEPIDPTQIPMRWLSGKHGQHGHGQRGHGQRGHGQVKNTTKSNQSEK